MLLVGFMGAGKSRVARELARRTGWRVLDFDHEVEAVEGRTIPEIFRDRGEAEFREIEHRVAQRLLAEDRVILSSGGGWPSAGPGRMEGLDPRTLSVWLRISPEAAVARIRGGRGRVRPLLEVPDPVAEARRLLELREGDYAKAKLWIEAESSNPRASAGRIASLIEASWSSGTD